MRRSPVRAVFPVVPAAVLIFLASGLPIARPALAAEAPELARYAKYAAIFEQAYALHPEVPRGLLEAVAYRNTYFVPLQPAAPPAGSEGAEPEVHGLMGLISDGSGVFTSTLEEVAALSGVAVEEIRNDPAATNVLAFTSAYAVRRAQLGTSGTTIAEHLPVLVSLSGFTQRVLGQSYPLDHYVYSVLEFLRSPDFQSLCGFPAYDIDLEAIFGAERLAFLRSGQVTFTSGGSSLAQAGTAEAADDPSATFMSAGCDDVKTFERGGGPTHVAIHVAENNFERALTLYLRCGRQESPHYLLSDDGATIVQLIREAKGSFHLDTPDANRAAIGVTHAGFSNAGSFSGGMLAASAGLVRRIGGRNGIDTGAMYTELGSGLESRPFPLPDCIAVKGHDHFEFQSGHDPGPFWPWAGYFTAVNGAPPPSHAPRCLAENLNTCSGAITDDNASIFGNGFYGDQARQIATILAPPGAAAIRLDFESFAMASGDWLYVYDGACTTDRLLGGWSGQHAWAAGFPVPFTPPGSIVSGGPQMTVETRTDCAIGAPGFEATWTSLRSDGEPFCCPVPRHFRVTDRRQAGVVLAWDAVSGATEYQVQWRRRSFGGDTAWSNPLTVAGTSTPVDGLEPGTVYEFRLRSHCGGGDYSGYNYESGSTCRADGGDPQPCSECVPPTNLQDDVMTASRVRLTWDAAPGAVSYLVQYRVLEPPPPEGYPDTRPPWSAPIPTDRTRLVLENLQASTDYEFRVQTVCSTAPEVKSPFSLPKYFTTFRCQNPGFLVLNGPNFEVLWEDYTTAKIRWPDLDGRDNPDDRSEVDGYILEYKERDQDWQQAVPVSVDTDPFDNKVTHTLSRLVPNTAYQVRVITVCAAAAEPPNQSDPTDPLDFTTHCRAPGEGHAAAPPPPDVTAQADVALVEWGETEIRSYELEHKEQSDPVWTRVPQIGGVTNFLLEDLVTGHDYDVRVRTRCSSEDVSQWAAAQFTTPCEPPSNLRLVEAGPNFMEVKWDPLAADRTRVLWKPRSEGAFDSDRLLSVNRSYIITHWFNENSLRQCTEYDVELKSVCPRGDSEPTAGRFSTLCPCANPMVRHGELCSKLFILQDRTNFGTTRPVDVRWATRTRLDNDWLVEMRECSSYTSCSGAFTDLGNFRKRKKDKACENFAHIDYYADSTPGLTTFHYYQVRARMLCDNGLYTEPLDEVYQIVPVSNFGVRSVASSSVTVGWDAAPGATGYVLAYGLPDQEAPQKIMLGSEAQSAQLTGLQEGQLYEVEITPLLAGGPSVSSYLEVTPQAPPCSYTLDPPGANVPPGGSTGNAIAVATQEGCGWSAHSNSSWIMVTAGQGFGGGTAVYNVAPNTSGTVRSGTIAIGDQTFFVSQEACAIVLQPGERSFSYTSDSDVINVSAPGGCAWTAIASAPWITITAGGGGNGSGTVSYSVSANTTTTWPVSRAGTVTIGGQTFTITQAGQPSCELSMGMSCDPNGLTGCSAACFTASGGTKTVYLWLSRPDCDWTPQSNAPWLQITNVNDPGGNPRTFTYSVEPNTAGETRVGGIFTNGLQHRVTEGGTSAEASGRVTDAFGRGVAGVTISFGALIAYGSPAAVTTAADGSWSQSGFLPCKGNFATASLTGATLTPSRRFFSPGTANNDFSTDGASGGGGGGGGCSGSIAPGGAAVAGSGMSGGSVTVSAACSWTAASSVPWVTVVSGASGSGSGTVVYSVAANPAPSSRTGAVTVAGQSFVVTQEAASPCAATLSPASHFVPQGMLDSGEIAVTVAAGCPWTAAGNVSWLTILGGGSGSGEGTVVYEVAANPSTAERTGTLTVAGQTFTVTQQGAPCTYALAPASQSMASGGGGGSANVTAPAGCSWTGASSVAWITVNGGNGGTVSGSGNGTVTYTVAANASTASRTGTLTIAGRTLTVSQAGVPCSYTLSPTGASVASGGTSGSTVSLTASPASCAWTAASGASWITITAGASGSGNGTVSYNVAANTSSSSRTGVLTIAGQTFSVSQAASPALPAAPGGLGAVAASPTQIQLAWKDNSSDETGFTIERSTGGNSSFTVIATAGANVTSFTNSGLAQSTSYTYRVKATNAAGASAYSNQASATTPASAPPAAPSNLMGEASQSWYGIDVWWSDNSTNETMFVLEKRRSDSFPFVDVAYLPADTMGYSDADVSPGVTYVYRVRAYNSAGYSAFSAETWVAYAP